MIERRLDPEVRRARQNALCEGQDAFYVHFFELAGVAVHLRDRQFLAELVAVPVVRVDVNRPLVEERLIQTVEAFANRFLLSFDLGNPLLRVALEFAPGVEHAVLHEAHESGGRLQPSEFFNEQILEFRLDDVHGAASATAMVVRVVIAPSLGPTGRQRLTASLAAHVAAQRKVRIVPLSRSGDLVAAVENRLHAEKDRLSHEGIEVSASRHPEIRHVDPADVNMVSQHRVERLRWHRLPASRLQSQRDRVLPNFVLREASGREMLKRAFYERRSLGIGNQALPRRTRRVQVTKGSEKRPASELQRRLHSTARPVGAHVVVELGKRGEHTLHQLSGRRVVDGLGRRAKGDPERLEMRAEREVIVLFASESRQVENHDELHPALVRSAEVQELLELGAVGSLCALAFFAESRENFEALALAVFLAGLQLRGQTQILGLLFRADADVDDSTDHWPQLRPVRSREQDDLAVHRL